MKTLKAIWSDPVLSKVIAAGIIFILGAIILGTYSLITTKSFFDLFIQFFLLRVELWVVLLVAFIIVIISLTIPTKRKTITNEPTLNTRVLVDLRNPNNLTIATEQAKIWEKDKEVGEVALGQLEINKGVLNLKRKNKDGRFIIRILEYNNGNGVENFIKGNVHLERDRRILVSFAAKVIGGEHSIRVICTKKDSHFWVHKANFQFVINSKEYQEFNHVLMVPASEDFNIRMEDIEVENSQSSIQIKDFTVNEVS